MACRTHAHCAVCRNSRGFRESLLKRGCVDVVDFDCPEAARIGQTKGLPEMERKRGLGDVVEGLVKPIAKALGLRCLDAEGKLRPESGCAKRRDALNRVLPGGVLTGRAVPSRNSGTEKT
jgi:hypothetical protein